MKNCYFFIFCFALTMLACKNNPADNTSNAASTITLPNVDSKAKEIEKPKANSMLDSVAVAELTRDMWHYINTLARVEKAEHKGKTMDTGEDKGKYLQLNSDMTFEKGLYADKTDNGKWTYDAKKRIMFLDYAKETTVDEEWRVFRKEDMMVLIGNMKDVNQGKQIKMVRAKDKPTAE